MAYKVYRYIFPDGKIYIGMTKNTISQRRDNGYQHNALLKAHIKEYGWKDVQTDILADGLSKDKACQLEQDYIEKCDATNPSIGLNISKGGIQTFKGLKHTSEHRKYMSDLYKGRTFSKETLKKMSIAHEKEKHPVIRIDSNGNTELFKSLHEAAKVVNGYPTNIGRACDSGKEYKGYHWMKGGGDR